MLHAGGKFGGGGYKVSGGLHGVGMSVVNALSEWLEVRVERDGYLYQQEYKRGVPDYELRQIGLSDRTGTTISFKPDAEVFETTVYDRDTLSSRLRELGLFEQGAEDYPAGRARRYGDLFQFNGGLSDFVKYLNQNKDTLHPVLYFEGEKSKVQVEIALQYNDGYNENILSYVNNIHTQEGGYPRGGLQNCPDPGGQRLCPPFEHFEGWQRQPLRGGYPRRVDRRN